MSILLVLLNLLKSTDPTPYGIINTYSSSSVPKKQYPQRHRYAPNHVIIVLPARETQFVT